MLRQDKSFIRRQQSQSLKKNTTISLKSQDKASLVKRRQNKVHKEDVISLDKQGWTQKYLISLKGKRNKCQTHKQRKGQNLKGSPKIRSKAMANPTNIIMN